METDEIDRLLERYGAAEGRIAANLLDLHNHPTYDLLTSGALTGTTARRLGEFADEAQRLWTDLDALGVTLREARALRAEGRMNAERRARLAELLTGPSVLVDVSTTPLSERDLLDPQRSETRVSIDDLLARLRDLYEPLRDGVAAIDAVWRDVLPRLDAADVTGGELAGEVSELGTAEPSVGRLQRLVVDVRKQVMDDPLGLDPDIGAELDRLAAEAARHVGELRRSHDELDDDLARTEVLVAEARSLRARAAVALAEAQAKIVQPEDLAQVPSDAAIAELARRGHDLRASDESWHHVRPKLDAFLRLAERLVAQLTDAERRNRHPIEHRDQLRGLLSAYRAKAAAVGLIELPSVSDLTDEAHNELYTSPTNLPRAAGLVEAVAEAINRAGEQAGR